MIITIVSFKGGVAKSTSAVHLATYLQQKADTLLVDGDINRSVMDWANPGKLTFKVVDEKQGVRFARDFEHIVIDTAARPSSDELKTIAGGCDLMILPTTPDALSLRTLLEMVETLKTLNAENFKILLTIVPPPPNQSGQEARKAIESSGLPLFKTHIRRLGVFAKASLEGVPVQQVKDRYARIAWECYRKVGKEILP